MLSQDKAVFLNSSENKNLVKVYEGIVTEDKKGNVSRCISRVADYSKLAVFQLETNKGETFKEGDTVKLLANLKFKDASRKDLDFKLHGPNIRLCSDNK